MLEGRRRLSDDGAVVLEDVKRGESVWTCRVRRERGFLARLEFSELRRKVCPNCALEWLTLFAMASRVNIREMGVKKIQIGQLWRKNDTGEVYLVTRVYSEALSTIVVLRKSGAEDEALTRLRAENTPKGPGIPGYSPAQDEEKF
jgi:hypothetical protein